MYIHVEVVCMAVLKDDQFSVKKDLYAIWDSSRITFDKGRMTGAYIDIRLDQTDVKDDNDLMSRADKGELYENPSVNVTLDENNREVSAPVWYSVDAMNTMIEASGSRPDVMFVASGSTISIVSFSGELARRPDGTVEVVLPPEGSKDFAKYGLGPTCHGITDYVDYIDSEKVADKVRAYNEEKQNVKSAFDLTKGDQSHVHKDVDNRQHVTGDKQVASSRKYYKNQPLIAVWDLKDVRRNKDGTVKGAYVDMQVDQSTLSVAQAKAGRGFASPSVHYAYSKNPEQRPNKVFYTKRQLDDILSVGSVANAGSKTGVSFTGNVFTRTNSATGKQTSWVLTPKDPKSAKTKEELDNIEWYNAENKLGESQHGNFTLELLKKHFMNTRTVREVQAKNARFVDAVKSVGERTGEQRVEDMSVDYED